MISKIEVTQESQRALRVRLDGSRANLQRALSAGIQAATIQLASILKRDFLSGQLVNRRTGNLSRAVFTKMIDDLTGVVGVGKEAPYARFVNDGTRPHIIAARNAKALAFHVNGFYTSYTSNAGITRQAYNKGDLIFRKVVHHPGTKPRHFMEAALAAAKPEIQRIIEAHVSSAMKG